MKKRIPLVLVMLGVALGAAPTVGADEVDDLVRKLKPKQRYADYDPNFHVVTRQFTFHHAGGKVQKKVYRLVMDGDKYVALLRTGDVNLLAFTPDAASTKLSITTGRYHLDTLLGPVLTTNQFIQAKVYYTLVGDLDVNDTDKWVRDEKAHTLTLVRSTKTEKREVTNRITFAVDPVHGYTVTAEYNVAFEAMPTKAKFGAWAFCPGNYPPWKKDALYDRTVYSPGNGRTDYVGWANNLVCMDRCDSDAKSFCWRDQGFIAYLNPRTGWSPTRTRDDGCPDVYMRLCNAHNDFHISIPLPKELPQDEQGRYLWSGTHRLLAMPPELTRHVWDEMKLICRNQKAVIIKVGETEDFENQPVSLTEPARGLTWTSGGPKVSSEHARSGEQSLEIRGRQWPNLPQVSLKPTSQYVLEAYFKVRPFTAEELENVKKKDARRREKLRKKGEKIPAPVDWDNLTPQAYITADYYEWSPYSGKMLVNHKTNTISADKNGWQKVSVQLDTPRWDPFVNIAFHCKDGVAYMDDFALKLVADGEKRQEGLSPQEVGVEKQDK